MKSYGTFERRVAKALDSFPFIRASLRKVYQRINFLRFKEKNFQYNLADKVKLSIPFSKDEIDHEKETFFGYYDKSPWNERMTYYISHEISKEDEVNILVSDLVKNQTRIVGKSKTWNYQQGSMAQWLPNSDTVVYNDLENDKLVAKFYSLENNSQVIIPYPIQCIHPKGNEYLSLNYKRLDILRPEYGYNVFATNFSGVEEYDSDGIWKVNIETNDAKLIINIKQLIEYEHRVEMVDSKHKVNHVIYSPEGSKFIFMHRWIGPKGKFSRLYVSDNDGCNQRILLDDRMVSHYHWKDENYILVWGRKEDLGDHYYLINVNNGSVEIVGENLLDVFGDGHPSYSPDKKWIITDTYPDKARQRHLLLYNIQKNKISTVGRFFAPWKYDGENRCDLHPRWSPDGKNISFDSSHSGKRMNYVLDISSFIKDGDKN